MRLALATGWTEETIESWPMSRLNRWRVFDSIEPIGGRRLDHAAAVAAASAGGIKYSEAIIDWWAEPIPPEETAERIEEKAANFAKLLNRARGIKDADSCGT